MESWGGGGELGGGGYRGPWKAEVAGNHGKLGGGGGTWKAGVVGNHGKLGDLESIGGLGKRGGTVKN